MLFLHHIGIAYSGAEAPVSRLRALQVFACSGGAAPQAVSPFDAGARNWCRKEVARYIRERLLGDELCIIGIDHAFAFPAAYYRRQHIASWDEFLRHFTYEWPTMRDHMYVDFLRDEVSACGEPHELRLCERWTASARSVFQFDGHGTGAKAAHAGIPWLKQFRAEHRVRMRTHFWPFDGFDLPANRSVVCEVHPPLLRRRFDQDMRSTDQHDAYAIAQWLRDVDVRAALGDYCNPPLTLPERQQARLEGWMLGVR